MDRITNPMSKLHENIVPLDNFEREGHMNRKAPCLVPSQGKRDVVYVPPNNRKKFKIPYCHCSNTDCTVMAPDEHQALRAGWEFEMVGDEVKMLCPLCKDVQR